MHLADCSAAGVRCTVVLYNPKRSRQSHILNTSRKPVTCVRFSADGRYLVTGECGHQPAVRVWSVADRALLQEFSGHKYGVTCVVSADAAGPGR